MASFQEATLNVEDRFVHFCLTDPQNEREKIKDPRVHPGQPGLNFGEMITAWPIKGKVRKKKKIVWENILHIALYNILYIMLKYNTVL